MTRPLRFHALIPAAGAGSRFAAGLPKQYAQLDGKPVLQHALERLAMGFRLHMTYVALAVDDRWYDREIGGRDRVTALRCGGSTRAATVRNALAAIVDVASTDWIVVHDAARPCVDAASLSRLQHELVDDPVGGMSGDPRGLGIEARR